MSLISADVNIRYYLLQILQYKPKIALAIARVSQEVNLINIKEVYSTSLILAGVIRIDKNEEEAIEKIKEIVRKVKIDRELRRKGYSIYVEWNIRENCLS